MEPAAHSIRLVDTWTVAEWECYLEQLVIDCIVEAARGHMPSTAEGWTRVARRMGLKVHSLQLSFGACLIEDLVIWNARRPELAARYIAHEVVEHILLSDHAGRPPVHQPHPCDTIAHRIALRIDARLRSANCATEEKP